MKKTLILLALLAFLLSGCSPTPKELSFCEVEKLAVGVQCSVGHAGKCWCFLWDNNYNMLAMTWAPDEVCDVVESTL